MARFAILFLSLVAGFALIASTDWAAAAIHDPACRVVTILSAPVLSLFGDVYAQGTFIQFGGFSASIVEACNGVLPAYLFVSAVLAFPCSWRAKLLGLLIGVPGIFLINLLRVVSLMMVGAYWPEFFERIHIYVWQGLVIALSMGIWVFWAEVFVRPGVRLGS
jgi:exosortase H (IPTLxxWG-CTERM-specific)